MRTYDHTHTPSETDTWTDRHTQTHTRMTHTHAPHAVNAVSTLEVVLGLPYIHPIAFQSEGIQALVPYYQWEGLLLDGCGSQLNALQDCWVQHIDAGIDFVSNKCLHAEQTVRGANVTHMQSHTLHAKSC